MGEAVNVSVSTIGKGKRGEVFKSWRDRMIKGDDSVVPRTNLADTDRQLGQTFGELGSLDPPIDPLWLARLYSVSNSLRQCVDAMVTNVHLGGYTYEPILDLETDEGRRRVRNAITIEREIEAEDNAEDGKDPEPIEEVDDEELDQRIEKLRDQMWRERYMLDSFFENCCSKGTFEELRQNLGTDQESIGHAAFEVRRDRRGRPKRLRWAPAWTMRALPTAPPFKTKVKERVADFVFREEYDWIEWRKFVQDVDGYLTYFKEFGDPRVMSPRTGNYYKDEKELQATEPSESGEPVRPATEIIWIRLSNPESEIYGLVRFAGNLLSVVGSREMESVNFLFFDNKAIPPMVVLIHGGELAEGMKQELEDTIAEYIKGSDNFHGILVLSAAPSEAALPGEQQREVKIEFRPLAEAIFSDQLWGDYDEANRMKVRLSFRLAQLLVGDSKDFNRATAESALRYTDAQVFSPMRRLFDLTMNKTLLHALGICLWRFVSIAPKSEDNIAVAKALAELVQSVIGPEEARRILARVWGIDLARWETEWAQIPLKHALAGFSAKVEDEEEKTEGGSESGERQTNLSEEITDGDLPSSTVARRKDKPAEVRKVIDGVLFNKMFPEEEGGDES